MKNRRRWYLEEDFCNGASIHRSQFFFKRNAVLRTLKYKGDLRYKSKIVKRNVSRETKKIKKKNYSSFF